MLNHSFNPHTDLLTQIRKIINEELDKFREDINKAKELPKNLVNIKRVMTELGVSKATIYNWKAKGIIQVHKAGGKTLFNLSEIMANIKKNDLMFGKGRDYLYKKPAETREDEKLDRRYYNIGFKIRAGKAVSPDDLQFYEERKKIIGKRHAESLPKRRDEISILEDDDIPFYDK